MVKTLSLREEQRYARQLNLDGFGREGQLRLKSLRVLIVGVGGLGCPAALYLAAAGVGCIGLMDGDRVELSNLQRQVLYGEADIGQLKVDSAARELEERNSDIVIRRHPENLTRENIHLLDDYDIVIDGSDQLSVAYLLNLACKLKGKDFIFGGINGWQATVARFSPAGPCYRCVFPEAPPAGQFPSCSEAGVLGVLAGLAGTLQAALAIRADSGLHYIDLRSPEMKNFSVEKDPHCRCCSGKESLEEHRAAPEVRWEELDRHTLIDVRSAEERAQGHLPKSLHCPLVRLSEQLDALRAQQPLACYCRSGRRAQAAVKQLRSEGLDAYVLTGLGTNGPVGVS